jgi:hypothetical protein
LPTPPAMTGELLSSLDSLSFNGSMFWNSLWRGISAQEWAQLGHLLCRPWFGRVWIIQEVFALRDALIFNGSKSMPFWTLADAAQRIVTMNFDYFPTDVKEIAENLKNILFLS